MFAIPFFKLCVNRTFTGYDHIFLSTFFLESSKSDEGEDTVVMEEVVEFPIVPYTPNFALVDANLCTIYIAEHFPFEYIEHPFVSPDVSSSLNRISKRV